MKVRRSHLLTSISLCIALASTSIATAQQQPVKYDSGTISGLPARNIGSATMSGRISAVTAANDSGRLTLFVGSASGGVWKSVNGALTFKPVFDSATALSIGALAIGPTNSRNVWAGAG